MTTPELLPCPICRGVGFHPYGFYAAIEYPSGSSAINISTEKCRSCNNGIIGLPTPDTRLLEAAKELLEVANLRGDDDLPHPSNDPKLWTSRMQDAWDELRAALAAIEGKDTP